MLTYRTNIKTAKPKPPDFWIINTNPPYMVLDSKTGDYAYCSGEKLEELKSKYTWAFHEPNQAETRDSPAVPAKQQCGIWASSEA